jgi:hypothetical protein
MGLNTCCCVECSAGQSAPGQHLFAVVGPHTHLGLCSKRRLEVIENKDEDEQVVYAERLLQQVAGKVLLCFFWAFHVPA